MAVDAAATTSAEAAQYRAAGWWSDATLSDRVAGHAAATPDKPAYVDFRTDAADTVLTWAEFDNAATNLAVQLREQGVHPGDRVAVWHGDTSAIHVLLVAVERCGAVAVGLGARAGVREVAHIVGLT
nr:AMP-binding protein [Mycobacterium sp.]